MLPIRKVVLYKHGVGYFERRGDVQGDASVDLHFKAPEMNDVLKSLTTLDLSDGTVSSISYESVAGRPPDENPIASKKKDLKRVTIFAKGKGSRTILASYVVEAPVWKASYRM